MELGEYNELIKEDSFSDDEPVRRPKSRHLTVGSSSSSSRARSIIHAVTWNTNGKSPPANMSNLFLYTADIEVISLQELGSQDWSTAIDICLADYGLVRIKTRRLQGIMMVVYAQRNLLDFITHIESEITKTGMGGMWGNKGAVSIRFDVFGVNLIFVNSHLAAHAEHIAQRIQDISDIIDSQQFRDEDVNNILDHDYVFWMGDLNFRLDLSYEKALTLIMKGDIAGLLENDQLNTVMDEGLIFQDFKEAPIAFKPTYKFDPGTSKYDTSPKKRVPSYTDRILYFFHPVTYGKKDHLGVTVSHYQSHPSFKESDHKPVSATMDICGISKPSINPVTFKISKVVSKKAPMNVSYISRDVELSSSDWIGIYPAEFHNLMTDYTTYNYAHINNMSHPYSGRVQIPMSSLTNLQGGEFYVLCYISKKHSFSGMSKAFKVTG